jgi:hypothetical protein
MTPSDWVARSARLQQLQRDNGIVNVKGERASVRATDMLDEQTSFLDYE